MNNDDDFVNLGEELYENETNPDVISMPSVPSGPIYPKVPTTIPMPKPIVTQRNEIVEMRTRLYDQYVDVMHKTLQGFSKLPQCRRTKEVNDGVAKIKQLIGQINMYDERLKTMTGGKVKNRHYTNTNKNKKKKANKRKNKTKKYKK